MGESAAWIKLYTAFLGDEKMDYIEDMENGHKLIVLWIKMLLLAGKCNAGGYLQIYDGVPFKKEAMAKKFRCEISILNLALEVFNRLGMIGIDNCIYIKNFNKYQDCGKLNEQKEVIDKAAEKREKDRVRQANHREKKKLEADFHSDGVASKDMENMSVESSEAGARDNKRDKGCDKKCDKQCDIECDNICDTHCDSSYSYSFSASASNSGSNYKFGLGINSNNNSSRSSNSNSSSNYIEFLYKNFKNITEHEIDTLRGYERRGLTPEMLNLALIEAVSSNGKNLNYVKRILERWLKDNIMTPEAFAADKEEFNQKKIAERQRKRNSVTKQSTFNNFQQREYDYDDLEKRLLGWESVSSNN